MIKIFKYIFEKLREFFKTKFGKAVAGVGIAGGVVAGAAGIYESTEANKSNRLAESIRNSAIEKYEKHKEETEKTLNEIGKIKIDVADSFKVFANLIEQIQSKPIVKAEIAGIDLPNVTSNDLKLLSKKIEECVDVAIGGIGGLGLGFAVIGFNALALSPAALAGGIVLCAVGVKAKKQSAKNLKTAQQIKKDAYTAIKFYDELNTEAKEYLKVLSNISKIYVKQLKKVEHIVSKKTDWFKYKEKERNIVENAILLTRLLIKIFNLNLVINNTDAEGVKSINHTGIKNIILETDTVLKEIK